MLLADPARGVRAVSSGGVQLQAAVRPRQVYALLVSELRESTEENKSGKRSEADRLRQHVAVEVYLLHVAYPFEKERAREA